MTQQHRLAALPLQRKMESTRTGASVAKPHFIEAQDIALLASFEIDPLSGVSASSPNMGAILGWEADA